MNTTVKRLLFKNHFSGYCVVSNTHVPSYGGYYYRDEAAGGKFVVVSAAVADAMVKRGEAQVGKTFMQDGSAPFSTSQRPGSKVIGKTKGLSVAETWAYVFAHNEDCYENGNPTLTDEGISEFMRDEFPNQPVTASEPKRVKMWRGNYNHGAHSFNGRGIPKKLSHEYDAAGNRVEARRVSGAGVDVGAIVERAKEAGAAAGKLKAQVLLADAKKELADRPIVSVSVGGKKAKKVDTKGKHARFMDVLKRVEAGLPVLLVGPTGSGKTYLTRQVAEALDLRFSFNSMSEGVSESALLGRMLPTKGGEWKYQASPFVAAYSEGGLHLLDEIDASDPNLLVTVNAAIANGVLSLPAAGVEPVERHEDFVLIAAANTYGNGADRMYVGRNQLDAATVNRFLMGTVEVDYDRDLEARIVEAIMGKDVKAANLLAWAWRVRERIMNNRLRRTMSTRTIEDAAKLLAVGADMPKVEQIFFLGWSADEKAKTV